MARLRARVSDVGSKKQARIARQQPSVLKANQKQENCSNARSNDCIQYWGKSIHTSNKFVVRYQEPGVHCEQQGKKAPARVSDESMGEWKPSLQV